MKAVIKVKVYDRQPQVKKCWESKKKKSKVRILLFSFEQIVQSGEIYMGSPSSSSVKEEQRCESSAKGSSDEFDKCEDDEVGISKYVDKSQSLQNLQQRFSVAKGIKKFEEHWFVLFFYKTYDLKMEECGFFLTSDLCIDRPLQHATVKLSWRNKKRWCF